MSTIVGVLLYANDFDCITMCTLLLSAPEKLWWNVLFSRQLKVFSLFNNMLFSIVKGVDLLSLRLVIKYLAGIFEVIKTVDIVVINLSYFLLLKCQIFAGLFLSISLLVSGDWHFVLTFVARILKGILAVTMVIWTTLSACLY